MTKMGLEYSGSPLDRRNRITENLLMARSLFKLCLSREGKLVCDLVREVQDFKLKLKLVII